MIVGSYFLILFYFVVFLIELVLKLVWYDKECDSECNKVVVAKGGTYLNPIIFSVDMKLYYFVLAFELLELIENNSLI